MLRPALMATMLAVTLPASAQDAYLDDRSTPQALVKSLYNAINRREYARAYGYFGTPPAADVDAYAEGYEDTERVELVAGAPAEEGAAGSTFYNLPVAIQATSTDGSQSVFAGCYTLRLANPAIQGAPFQPLHIERGSLRPSDGELVDAVPTSCPDGPPLPRADLALDEAKAMFAASKPEICDDVPADDEGPQSYDIPFNYEYDEADQPQRIARLFRFFCYRGAYNEIHVYYLADDDGAVSPLQFAEPELDIRYVGDDFEGEVEAMNVTGFSATAELVNSDYDEQTQTLSEFSKWRGIGDASSSGRWTFKNGRFRLVHYAVDASYDGEQNPETVVDYEVTP